MPLLTTLNNTWFVEFSASGEVVCFRCALIQPGLGPAVVVMAVVMMMRGDSERRGGEDQDQEHGSKDLLHAVNLA